MREYIKEFLSVFIASLLIVILFMQVVAVKNVERINNGLKEEIEYLDSRIELYENNEEWFEDYIDILGDTWEREVEIEVLKERIYWLNKYKESTEYNKAYADQMYEDLETYLIVLVRYVEEHGNLDNFNDYFYSYYRDLYDRIDNIYGENH